MFVAKYKALSFIQPYAWLTATGIKPIDNRSRYTNFRGKFYIHASKKSNPNIAGLNEDWIIERLSEYERERYFTEPKTLGAIIGEAVLVDCVKEHISKWFVGKYGLIIHGAKLYNEPIPCRGKLNFFIPELTEVESDIELLSRHDATREDD